MIMDRFLIIFQFYEIRFQVLNILYNDQMIIEQLISKSQEKLRTVSNIPGNYKLSLLYFICLVNRLLQ